MVNRRCIAPGEFFERGVCGNLRGVYSGPHATRRRQAYRDLSPPSVTVLITSVPVFDQRVSMPDASSPFMKASAAELLARLPGRPSALWPQGERFLQALNHGSMTVELYAPVGTDPQQPHQQDELYFVISGTGEFVCGQERSRFGPSTVLFVPAGAVHRFENFSTDFATWVVFWGPRGGES